ncbi:MAG TPA: ParB N-terminal domain-containing protein [Bacteroidota bacterium]|nr:ParB N-terminal domain-containing protein [Bacteroidota bacterium]
MAKTKAPAGPKLSRFQKFEIMEIRRSMLREAPYNPRTITEHASKKLRKKLRDVGLIEPLIWNKQTGNLVSGHRRLEILDGLEGYPARCADYLLSVSVVDLDLKTEKEMNLFLNNASAQGEWDLDKLKVLLTDEGVSFEMAGFDPQDMAVYDISVDTMGLSDVFGGENDPQADAQMDAIDGARVAESSARSAASEKVRQDRHEYREAQAEVNEADFFLNVVFQTKREKSGVLTALRMFAHQEFVKADRLFVILDEFYANGGKLTALLSESGGSEQGDAED